MSVYKTQEVEDHPLDWVDINHPLNRISLPFYNLALEIHRRRWLITSVAAAVVAIIIPLLFFLTAAHLPYMYFHLVPKFMRLSWDTEEICYSELGCFSTNPPFHLLPLPWQPEAVNVNLYLVTKNGSYHFIPPQLDKFPLDLFDRNADTKLLFHGLRTHKYSQVVKNTALAFHQNKASKNYNVFVVDWSAGCEHHIQYFHAASNTRIVGAIVANWLRQMTDRHQYSLENVHCIGHSLGAHICGFIGKRIPLVRITGLDPARFAFTDAPPEARLHKSDARFVDVIHTDIGKWGLEQPVGHVDFYPNGGASQDGCEWENEKLSLWRWLICDHMMSMDFFARSYIDRDQIPKAVPCKSLSAVKKENCSCDGNCDLQEIGENTVLLKGEGIYHVKIPRLQSLSYEW